MTRYIGLDVHKRLVESMYSGPREVLARGQLSCVLEAIGSLRHTDPEADHALLEARR